MFFKVGLLTIIGLSAKNAILIVEFAKDLQAQGDGSDRSHAHRRAVAAAPDPDDLAGVHSGRAAAAISTGAGAASRHDIGTGVVGGMISATMLAVFLVPVFYVVVRRTFKGKTAPALGSRKRTGPERCRSKPKPGRRP